MNLRRDAGQRHASAARSSAVELTPLIDVVFLLLIFFMVSTTFVRESVLDVVLAEALGAPPTDDDGEIDVRVSAAGEYAVDGRRLADASLPGLLDALREASAGDAGRAVVVAADAGARHEAVMRVLDAAGQAGLTRLRLAVQEPAGGAARRGVDGG